MPVTHVGSSTAGANTATIAPAWPAGTASGDVAYLFWVMVNTATPNVPTGFTQVAANDMNGSGRTRIYRKVLSATESGSLTLSNTTSLANRQSAVLTVYRGVLNSTPEDSTPSFRSESVAGTTHANPSETTTVAGCVIVTSVFERSTTGTNAWTPPSGYVERGDTLALAVGSGGTITAVADDLASKAIGTYTPGVWTSGNGFSTINVSTYTMALREAPAATGMVEHVGIIPI